MEKLEIPNIYMLSVIEEILQQGNRVKLPVKGGSMYPLIRNEKESVIIEKADTASLKKGDIILFRVRDGFILHRIVKIAGSQITAQGDGNIGICEQTKTSEVIGVARAIVFSNGISVKTDSVLLKLFAWLWVMLHPLRRYLLGIFRKVCH